MGHIIKAGGKVNTIVVYKNVNIVYVNDNLWIIHGKDHDIKFTDLRDAYKFIDEVFLC